MATNFNLRSLQESDLTTVSTVHLEAFTASALSRLGFEVVNRYYHWQLLGPHDVDAIGVWDGDQLAGFYFGGVFRNSTAGFLRKNRSFLVWRVLTHPWLLGNPLFRERFWTGLGVLRRMVYSQTVPATTNPSPMAKSYGILVIAVSPRFQRRGVGKQLMDYAYQQAVTKKFTQMHLTVHSDNFNAIRFYESLGWIKNEESGSWKGRMVFGLT